MSATELEIAAAVRDGKLLHWKEEVQGTSEVMRRIPTDKLEYKPHEKSMPALQLAQHIFQAEAMFVDGVVDGKFDYEGSVKKLGELPKDPAKLAEQYLQFFETSVAKLKAVTPKNLAKPLAFMPQMPASPVFVYLAWMLSHTTHHRGQLTVYLRLMGAKVPAIYGPSADDNPFK